MQCDKLRHRKVPKISLLCGRNQRSALDPDESRYFVQFRHFCGNNLGENGVFEPLCRLKCTPDACCFGPLLLENSAN